MCIRDRKKGLAFSCVASAVQSLVHPSKLQMRIAALQRKMDERLRLVPHGIAGSHIFLNMCMSGRYWRALDAAKRKALRQR
eukprot:11615532-Prorocentrum_lima.AAC.1